MAENTAFSKIVVVEAVRRFGDGDRVDGEHPGQDVGFARGAALVPAELAEEQFFVLLEISDVFIEVGDWFKEIVLFARVRVKHVV